MADPISILCLGIIEYSKSNLKEKNQSFSLIFYISSDIMILKAENIFISAGN